MFRSRIDVSDNEAPATTNTAKPASALPTLAPPIVSRNRRFEGEDEEEAEDDWDASSDDEAKKASAPAAAAPVRKKKGLKQILAEKEAAVSIQVPRTAGVIAHVSILEEIRSPRR